MWPVPQESGLRHFSPFAANAADWWIDGQYRIPVNPDPLDDDDQPSLDEQND
jgi:endogenous inhibitor of DNA gyrase (YacG/DUF329 family)